MVAEHQAVRAAATYGVPKGILRKSGKEHRPVELIVQDASGLLYDPRFVGLARAALAYKQTSGIRLRIGQDIIVVQPGRPLAALIGGVEQGSTEIICDDLLDELEGRGVGLGSLLEDDAEAVS
jgi:hypothetical protein